MPCRRPKSVEGQGCPTTNLVSLNCFGQIVRIRLLSSVYLRDIRKRPKNWDFPSLLRKSPPRAFTGPGRLLIKICIFRQLQRDLGRPVRHKKPSHGPTAPAATYSATCRCRSSSLAAITICMRRAALPCLASSNARRRERAAFMFAPP